MHRRLSRCTVPLCRACYASWYAITPTLTADINPLERVQPSVSLSERSPSRAIYDGVNHVRFFKLEISSPKFTFQFNVKTGAEICCFWNELYSVEIGLLFLYVRYKQPAFNHMTGWSPKSEFNAWSRCRHSNVLASPGNRCMALGRTSHICLGFWLTFLTMFYFSLIQEKDF